MKIKQLFCNHIWEDLNHKILREYSETMVVMGHIVEQYKVADVVVRQSCIKCDKKRMVEDSRRIKTF